jgi:hypothetical protein
MADNTKKLTAQEEHEQKCVTCNRDRGLTILLTRYAIASKDLAKMNWYKDRQGVMPTPLHRSIADSNAPALNSNFKCDTAELADPTIYYTQRRLRAGYVYVYNEALGANKWKAYTISEQGYLTPFEVDHDPEEKPQAIKPCKPESKGIIASCITIQLPYIAKDIWIGY